jgi:hypothetical protein
MAANSKVGCVLLGRRQPIIDEEEQKPRIAHAWRTLHGPS